MSIIGITNTFRLYTTRINTLNYYNNNNNLFCWVFWDISRYVLLRSRDTWEYLTITYSVDQSRSIVINIIIIIMHFSRGWILSMNYYFLRAYPKWTILFYFLKFQKIIFMKENANSYPKYFRFGEASVVVFLSLLYIISMQKNYRAKCLQCEISRRLNETIMNYSCSIFVLLLEMKTVYYECTRHIMTIKI